MVIDWNVLLSKAVETAVIVLVPMLCAWLSGVLSAWRDSLKAKESKEWYEKAGVMLGSSVLSTMQILVNDAKDAAKDGKLSEDEKARAFAHARDAFLSQVGEIPAAVKPTIEAWIKAQIEAKIAKLKLEAPKTLPFLGRLQDKLSGEN